WLSARPNGALARLTIRRVRSGNTPSRLDQRSVGQSPIRAARTRNSAMRTSRRAIVAFVLGAAALAAPALAFDGAPVNQKDATIPVVTTLPGAAGKVRNVPPAVA